VKTPFLSLRRFLAKPFHPPGPVIYSFILAERFMPGHVTSVLEVGCGMGVFALRFAAQRPSTRVLAVDHSKAVIEYLVTKCEPLFPNLRFRQIDFCGETAEMGQFQVVYSSDVFEHVRDVSGFVRNTYSALETRGLAIVNFPNRDDHGINHFSDTSALSEVFDKFSDVKVHDVVWSNNYDKPYFALRSFYERIFSGNTAECRAAADHSDSQGVDCFEESSCYEFVRSASTVKNAIANIASFLILGVLTPVISVKPITGSIRNKDRLVIVATK
jgi:SAM-dependent methyltransferase